MSKYHKIEMDIILLVRSRRSLTAFKLIDPPSLSHRQALLLGSAAYATDAKKVCMHAYSMGMMHQAVCMTAFMHCVC